MRPVLTKVAGKFQVTVPPEVRALFDLREGDLLEWSFDPSDSRLTLTPKRAQLLTVQVKDKIAESRRNRANARLHASV
jgi:AbrB family looped-hinge helix DNA binding protein